MPAITVIDLVNAKTDVDHVAAIATSTSPTATDRLGNIKQTIAGAVSTIASINNRGAWAASTVYALKDVVLSSGTWYVCVVAHTSSAAFATDTATKWRVYQGITSAELSATDGATKVFHGTTALDSILKNSVGKVVTSIATLKTVDKLKYTQALVTGYYTNADGGGGVYYYDSTDTTTADNGGTVIVAADGGRWKLLHAGIISVKNFGAKGDDVTDDTAALTAARNWIASPLIAGNSKKVIFTPGRYKYSASPNWGINRLDLEFQGEVWLVNTGTGASFIIDGGATGAGVYGLKIKGYPLLYGGATTTHGYYMRGVHRSHLEINARGAGSSYSGLYMEWCVSNSIYYIMNINEGGLYNTPARGITMTIRGAGEESSYNNFYNTECSGMPVGIYEDGSLGNVFFGGAVQGCTNVGLQQTVNAWENKFIGTDFEVNANGDIECNARESQFIGCDLEKKITFQSASVNCSMIGGTTENIVTATGAARTLLSGVTYNRFGLGTITDGSTSTRFRDMRNKVGATVENSARTRTTVTIGASPYTYTNTTGNEMDLLIVGGTVSQLVYTRFAGDVVLPASGMFRLSPGDSMGVTYTVAPAITAYTR